MLVFLFTLALVLRLNNLDTDPYGDEAFYFYLSRHPESYFTNSVALGHPPLLYYLYRVFSNTLTNFRLVNIIVGAMVPCLIYLILSKKGVTWLNKIAVSTFFTFHYIFVKYSTIVFLDMLGTFFALMALFFYLRENNKIYAISLFFALMTKEYFIIFALVQIVTHFFKKRRIHKPTVIALGLFGIWCLHYVVRGPPTVLLIVHSINPLELDGLNRMFVNLFFIPMIALTFKKANLEFFLVPIAYSFFLFFWGTCEEWYLLLPIAINSCLIALAVDQIFKSKSPRMPSKIQGKVKLISILFMAILFIYSSSSEIELTTNYIQNEHWYELQEASDFLKTQFYNQDLILIDCFWAYSSYPLGEFMNVLYESWSHQENLQSLQWGIDQVGLCILGKTGTPTNIMLQASFKDAVVFENIGYTIIHTTT